MPRQGKSLSASCSTYASKRVALDWAANNDPNPTEGILLMAFRAVKPFRKYVRNVSFSVPEFHHP